jgi:hypothetical protein
VDTGLKGAMSGAIPRDAGPRLDGAPPLAVFRTEGKPGRLRKIARRADIIAAAVGIKKGCTVNVTLLAADLAAPSRISSSSSRALERPASRQGSLEPLTG